MMLATSSDDAGSGGDIAAKGGRDKVQAIAVFSSGSSCDILDRLPGTLDLPEDVKVGDYVLFDGLGAYSMAMSTAFNGYGPHDIVNACQGQGPRCLTSY